MGRPKKDSSPGCIFARNNKLYIKIKNRQYSTGFNDTKEGRDFAIQMKNEMYIKDLRDKGHLPKVSNMTVLSAFQDYINRLENKGRSRNTVRGYELAFATLFPVNVELSPDAIKGSVNKAVKALIEAKKVTYSTINIYVDKVQLFLNDCNKKGLLEMIDIKEDHKRPVAHKVVQPYSSDEYNAIIQESQYPTTSNIRQDREFTLLLMFLYETGGRIKETLGLKWDNLDLKGRTITFSNKINRHKEDVIPISEKLIPILNELKNISDSRKDDRTRIKLFRWGENSSSRLNRKLTSIESALGIKIGKQAFHRFRNTFSDRLSQANIPILLYSDLMRHKDYRTTLNHYRIQHIEKLREVIDSI